MSRIFEVHITALRLLIELFTNNPQYIYIYFVVWNFLSFYSFEFLFSRVEFLNSYEVLFISRNFCVHSKKYMFRTFIKWSNIFLRQFHKFYWCITICCVCFLKNFWFQTNWILLRINISCHWHLQFKKKSLNFTFITTYHKEKIICCLILSDLWKRRFFF